ncbi:transcription termination factor Rho [Iamia majanohamensis]|uniref:Transcription termination factor Rho n=1 Tax=Iamia majanohamensis TaxID=467976 RepID=A0AAE9YCS8_9ACTN|nr:transcription termination factor Rho [Iamia majanohamensis]WCO66452.1 transcription termination factor Rho [Iamia majanohamensis]
MSGFERSLLEGKERDELSQIAESLGKKPPARAKKATIIDLILELAGVSGADGDEAGGGSDGPTDADATGEAAASGDDGRAPDDKGGDDRSQGDQGGGGRSGGDQGRGGDRSGGGQPKGDRSGGDQAKGHRSGGDQGRDDRDGADDGGRGQGEGSDQGDGGRDQDPNQKQGGDRNQGDEDGNRRRRRRGRGRGDQQQDGFEGDPIDVEGLLDLRDDGYGFLRLHGYLPSSDDVYVSVKQVRQLGLRKGDRVKGKSRPASRNEKNPALLQIDAVNGGPPDASRDRRRFADLTPLFPDERLKLETEGASATMTTRIIDLLAPVGKGQRGLIVSPPKAGKTTIMKQIARAIELNDPEVDLIVLLVDERPEEVTDMKRWLINGEVAASTFDRPSEEHIAVSELVIERAKRMVEDGKDVVIILDGITRLARAHNLATPPSGRIMSGGIDAAALYPPKRFFGAARNAEEGGSLTILATALVETGSKMDEHIFEEFKGTGNMELRLSRHLAERRIFPAIDVDASSTRHEELLFERKQVAQVTKLRRVLGALKDGEGASEAASLELLLDRMKTFKTNDEFLAEVGKASSGA